LSGEAIAIARELVFVWRGIALIFVKKIVLIDCGKKKWAIASDPDRGGCNDEWKKIVTEEV
jgi:hypothetical protein